MEVFTININQLNEFLEINPVEWIKENEDTLIIRHKIYDKESGGIKIDLKKLNNITEEQLEKAVVNGRNVDQITRITGYFSKLSNWNAGKKGEFKDRQRVNIETPLQIK